MAEYQVTRDQVRDRYAAAAASVLGGMASGGCCGQSAGDDCCAPADGGKGLGSVLYSASEQAELPDAAVAASLGCGNPVLVADLRPGETVLDLGSGGGIDVL